MIYSDVSAASLCSSAFEINRAEAARRMKVDREFDSARIPLCEQKLLSCVSYKYAYTCVPLSFPSENVCNLGFAEAQSTSLYKNLFGCDEAFVFAVTIGIGADRLIKSLSAVSRADAFITDALASAAAETLCEYADNLISGGLRCRPRFSPGYGDLSLKLQKPLLERLDAASRLGITLNASCLMTPMKSVTAIKGILR